MVRRFHQKRVTNHDNFTSSDTVFKNQEETKIPVLTLALTISLGLLSVILLVTLYLVRRQRQTDKYKQYSQITKTAVHPTPSTVETAQQPPYPVAQISRSSRCVLEKVVTSEESPSPLSSEEMFYEAQDRVEGLTSRSVSSREQSPAPEENNESDEDEMYPIENLGRIWFHLEYDGGAESLALTLVKARNLSCGDKAVKTCDPFVKVHILCPEEKYVVQSKCKRKTYRPNFDEMFYFNLPVSELERCTLRLCVYDGYRASQQSVVGQVLYQLIELDRNQKVELWRDLQAVEEHSSELGDIHLSVSYYPTLDRLTIIVLRACNLKKMEPHGTDSYATVTFSVGNKIIKTKKGNVHHATRDPLYNESFNFTVSGDDLGTSTLLVSIMHSRGEGKEDKLIGRVLLGGMMYARGAECEHWTEMMTNPRSMIKYWHTLTS